MPRDRFAGSAFLRELEPRVVSPGAPAAESTIEHACSCTLPPMESALERVQARAAAITAHRAAIESGEVTVNAVPLSADDPAAMRGEVDDLMGLVSDLVDRVGVLEQAAVADALEDLDEWTEPDEGMVLTPGMD